MNFNYGNTIANCKVDYFRMATLIVVLQKYLFFMLNQLQLIMTLMAFFSGFEAVRKAWFVSSSMNRCEINFVTSIAPEATN